MLFEQEVSDGLDVGARVDSSLDVHAPTNEFRQLLDVFDERMSIEFRIFREHPSAHTVDPHVSVISLTMKVPQHSIEEKTESTRTISVRIFIEHFRVFTENC